MLGQLMISLSSLPRSSLSAPIGNRADTESITKSAVEGRQVTETAFKRDGRNGFEGRCQAHRRTAHPDAEQELVRRHAYAAAEGPQKVVFAHSRDASQHFQVQDLPGYNSI